MMNVSKNAKKKQRKRAKKALALPLPPPVAKGGLGAVKVMPSLVSSHGSQNAVAPSHLKKKSYGVRVKKGESSSLLAEVSRDAVRGARVGRDWAKCLTNPFHNPPVPLGCGVPTFISTASYRGALTLTAGVGAILTTPSSPYQSSAIQTWATLALPSSAFTGGTSVAYTNGTAATANASAARMVGLGVRVWSAATAVQAIGEIGIGIYPQAASSTFFTSSTVNDIMNWPSTEVYPARPGEQFVASWRPIDNEDAEFFISFVTSGGTFLTTSIPYVVLSGFTASTVLNFECVMHIECLPNTPTTSMILDSAWQVDVDIAAVFEYMRDTVGPSVLKGAAAAGSAYFERFVRSFSKLALAQFSKQAKAVVKEDRAEGKTDDVRRDSGVLVSSPAPVLSFRKM